MLHFLISLFVIVKGPEDWHDLELKKDNQCGGNRQSPINIKTSEVEEEDSYRRLKITFDNARGLVTGTPENNGHSPELIIADSNGASLTGGPLGNNKFELIQFHVHFGCVNERGSEHKLNGKQLSGEVSDNNDVNLFSFTFYTVRYFSFLISCMARDVFVKGNDCNGRNDYPGRTGMYMNHQYSVLSYITRNCGRSAFLSDLSLGNKVGVYKS